MRLVLQRADADCGVAALATLLELTYEDVYLAAAAVEPKHRAKNGTYTTTLIQIARRLGVILAGVRTPKLDEQEGILRVTWPVQSSRKGAAHFVAIGYGVIADSTDGSILPADEYLLREGALAGSFLELR